MDREHRQSIKDALEFARKLSNSEKCVNDFAAYIIRRDGIMTKEKSERRVREYVEQES